jgi:hypothetical protein
MGRLRRDRVCTKHIVYKILVFRLSAVYGCPLIWMYSMGAQSVALKLVDQPANHAYSMDYLTSHLYPFTFYERAEQLYYNMKWNLYKWLVNLFYNTVCRPNWRSGRNTRLLRKRSRVPSLHSTNICVHEHVCLYWVWVFSMYNMYLLKKKSI